MSEIDPHQELERIKELPVEDRTEPVEKLIDGLERELEGLSPKPPAKGGAGA